MASDELTGTERLVLLILMAQGEETSNTRLKELGPELKKDSREKLNRLHLVSSSKIGQKFFHTLTEQGWAAARREFVSGPPPGALPQARGMYAVLAGVQRYLDREDLRASDVFRVSSPVPEDNTNDDALASSPRRPVSPPPLTDTKPSSYQSIEASIRRAYDSHASRKGAWVTLRDIRSALTNIPKPKLDRALGEMYRVPGVSLIAEENQKTLTAEVRNASITIGGQPVHLIAIEG